MVDISLLNEPIYAAFSIHGGYVDRISDIIALKTVNEDIKAYKPPWKKLCEVDKWIVKSVLYDSNKYRIIQIKSAELVCQDIDKIEKSENTYIAFLQTDRVALFTDCNIRGYEIQYDLFNLDISFKECKMLYNR